MYSTERHYQQDSFFSKSSKEYNFFCHSIETKIQRRNVIECQACGKNALFVHADGNFKLYRLDTAKE